MTFYQRHAYDIGCGIAALFWPFFVRRRRISVENILKCKITDGPKEARRIAKKAFCHFAGHICEALCVPQIITKENFREHLDFDSPDVSPKFIELLFEKLDEPILIASGHHGAWEAATSLVAHTRPMITIARMMDSKLLRNWLEKHHFRGSVTVINKSAGMNKAVFEEWATRRSAMTILIDQHASKGALLQFLGRPARSVTSVARLAIRTGYQTLVGIFVRVGPYKYRIVGGDPMVFGPDDDRDRVAQILNDRLGEAIRKYPEQYLWMHRRWRDD